MILLEIQDGSLTKFISHLPFLCRLEQHFCSRCLVDWDSAQHITSHHRLTELAVFPAHSYRDRGGKVGRGERERRKGGNEEKEIEEVEGRGRRRVKRSRINWRMGEEKEEKKGW